MSWDTQKRADAQRRRLCDCEDRDWNLVSWGHDSSNVDRYQKLEDASSGFSSTAYRGSIALPTSWFQAFGFPDCERIISVLLSHTVCDKLLLQPQETNTKTKIILLVYLCCFMTLSLDSCFIYFMFFFKFCSTTLLEEVFVFFFPCSSR